MTTSQYRPDEPSLLGPRLKLERAEQQLDELEPEIRAYSQREPHRLSEEPEIDGEWMVFRYVEVREYPDPRWGVRVGEFFHDLRSALDNLVWQLVLANDKRPGFHNQFPIFTRPEKPSSPSRLDAMLRGVAPDHAETIKRLQPYLGFEDDRDLKIALGGVAEMNNIDKHRALHPATTFSEEGEGSTPEHIGGPLPESIEVEHTMGPVRPGAEAFRWRVLGGTTETRVAIEGRIPFDIAFGHPRTTLAHLDWIREQIARFVEMFASAFPDGS